MIEDDDDFESFDMLPEFEELAYQAELQFENFEEQPF